MPRKTNPDNASFREAVRTFFQQPIQCKGAMDGCLPYEALAQVRDALQLDVDDMWRPEIAPVERKLMEDVNKIRTNLCRELDAGLKIIAWARKDPELIDTLGEATGGTQTTFVHLAQTLKDTKGLLNEMPLQCNPTADHEARLHRVDLLEAVRGIERLYEANISQAFENKKRQSEL